MEDALMKFAILIVGWLFGMLSPAVVESIRRARDVKPMLDSVADELHEFRYTTACTASVLRTHLGTANTEFHQWFKAVTDDYKGIQRDSKIREAAALLASLSDEEAETLSQYRRAGSGQALAAKELVILGLQARVSTLWMMPLRAQSELFRLLSDIAIYNQEMESGEHFRKLTFQKLENGNHEVVKDTLRTVYSNQAKVAQRIADQAGRCERGLKTGKWPEIVA